MSAKSELYAAPAQELRHLSRLVRRLDYSGSADWARPTFKKMIIEDLITVIKTLKALP